MPIWPWRNVILIWKNSFDLQVGPASVSGRVSSLAPYSAELVGSLGAASVRSALTLDAEARDLQVTTHYDPARPDR